MIISRLNQLQNNLMMDHCSENFQQELLVVATLEVGSLVKYLLDFV